MKALFLVTTILMSTSLFAQDKIREAKAIASLKDATEALASSNLECDSSADCVVLGLGSKACGGVSKFIITSSKNANFDEVEYLAERTNLRERAFNVRYGVISNCSMKMPPAPTCMNKMCI